MDEPIASNWRVVGQPAMAVVQTVAVATNREPNDLPPLAERISPDALNTLLTDGASAGTPTRLSFGYAGQRVTVHSDGRIDVQPAPDRE
jgi:hypothetical protein